MSTTIDGSASVTINSGAILGITSGTAVASTSGTSIDFTALPSWVKRITVMFNGINTSGSSVNQIQLGTGATPTYTTSGYSSTVSTTSNVSSGSITSGLAFNNNVGSVTSMIAFITNITGNTWVFSASGTAIAGAGRTAGGSIALGAALTAVRITTVNGTDTFTAGSINILYE